MIGGQDQDGSETFAIYSFHHDEWKHVGDMPFACSYVDTLLLSGGWLLVVDGSNTQQVLKITVKGKLCCTGIELIRLFSGLATLFSIPSSSKETDQKDADERYGNMIGTYSG